MSISLKDAVVGRERRFLLASLPEGVDSTNQIVDRYLTGLGSGCARFARTPARSRTSWGHEVRLAEGPAEVACTNFYLDDAEWAALAALPARILRKKRHIVHRDRLTVAIDEHEDGTLVAEIDDGDQPSGFVPVWLGAAEDVTDDERWTGAQLAR